MEIMRCNSLFECVWKFIVNGRMRWALRLKSITDSHTRNYLYYNDNELNWLKELSDWTSMRKYTFNLFLFNSPPKELIEDASKVEFPLDDTCIPWVSLPGYPNWQRYTSVSVICFLLFELNLQHMICIATRCVWHTILLPTKFKF